VVRRSLFARSAALMGIALLWMAARPTAAQSASIALTGVVSSQHEGAMEGVIVSARRAASTITVSVVTTRAGVTASRATGWNRGRIQFAFEPLDTSSRVRGPSPSPRRTVSNST
jgi:hypothetical protein